VAILTLDRCRLEKGDLPPYCMRCGDPATQVASVFLWADKSGAWGIRARFPVCATHRRPFVWQPTYLARAILLYCTGFTVLVWLVESNKELTSGWERAWWISLGILALYWAGFHVWLCKRSLRVLEITAKTVTLAGVSRVFFDACAEPPPTLPPPW
jgi:hypothetical protein